MTSQPKEINMTDYNTWPLLTRSLRKKQLVEKIRRARWMKPRIVRNSEHILLRMKFGINLTHSDNILLFSLPTSILHITTSFLDTKSLEFMSTTHMRFRHLTSVYQDPEDLNIIRNFWQPMYEDIEVYDEEDSHIDRFKGLIGGLQSRRGVEYPSHYYTNHRRIMISTLL
jgi:hypothetical protein